MSLNFLAPSFYLFDSLVSARADPYEGAPYVKFLGEQSKGHERIFAREGLLFPNWAGAFELQDVRDLDAMYYSRYIDFVRNLLRKPGDDRQSGDMADRFTGADLSIATASTRSLSDDSCSCHR